MKYLLTNWYRLVVAFSLFLFSVGFTIFVLKYNSAKAGEPTTSVHQTNAKGEVYVVAIGKNIYSVSYNTLIDKYEATLITSVR